MATKNIVAGLLVSAVASGAAGAAQLQAVLQDVAPAKGAPACTAVVVVGVGYTPGSAVFADGFEAGDLSAWTTPVALRATEVVDLAIFAPLPDGWLGDAEVVFELLTPSGALYESKVVAVSTTAARETSRRVADYPYPLPVQRLAGPASAAVGRFPVAGTSIVASGLYGTWSARAALHSGAPAPCWEPIFFELSP